MSIPLWAGCSSVSGPPETVSDEEFIAWTEANAVHLPTLDWNQIDLHDLSFLEERLDGKRVVYLGEPDHYIHEKYDYRLILIRYLVERGFRYLGIEGGLSDGRRIDSYLETGETAHLDRVALYGYHGPYWIERDGTPPNAPAVRAFHAEERWFLEQLRSISEQRPPGDRLHWFGFDVDWIPSGGYEDAHAMLDPHALEPVVADALERLERVPGELIEQEIARLSDLADFMVASRAALTPILGAESFGTLLRTVRGLRQGYAAKLSAAKGFQSEQWIQGLRNREAFMVQEMDAVLAGLDPDDKIILMGHNMHLSKDHQSVRFGPVKRGRQMWPSIGTHVHETLPGEVLSVWMLYDSGRHKDASGHEVKTVESDNDRVEYLLGQAGSAFLLPLHGTGAGIEYLGRDRNFVLNGDIGSGRILRQADVLFFVRTVSEPRRR